MQDLNCWDAMNLDGGGSTLLYANNMIVNKLNDDRGPRPVVSVIMIRNRTKKSDIGQPMIIFIISSTFL